MTELEKEAFIFYMKNNMDYRKTASLYKVSSKRIYEAKLSNMIYWFRSNHYIPTSLYDIYSLVDNSNIFRDLIKYGCRDIRDVYILIRFHTCDLLDMKYMSKKSLYDIVRKLRDEGYNLYYSDVRHIYYIGNELSNIMYHGNNINKMLSLRLIEEKIETNPELISELECKYITKRITEFIVNNHPDLCSHINGIIKYRKRLEKNRNNKDKRVFVV